MQKLLPPKVKKQYYNDEFWIKKISKPDSLLLKNNDISTLNSETYQKMKTFQKEDQYQIFEKMPEKLILREIKEKFNLFSAAENFPVGDFFNKKGIRITDAEKEEIIINTDLEQIKPDNLKYGLTVRRSSIRAFPTDTVFAHSPEYTDVDMMQLTAISPAEPAVILHGSRDKRWYYVQTGIHSGWIKKKDTAAAENAAVVEQYLQRPYLITADSRIITEPDPFAENSEQIEFQMGDKIRLAEHEDGQTLLAGNLHSQSDTGSYAVLLPKRDKKGGLNFKKALIAYSSGVKENLLPYTRAGILHQAFKMLGERYGWGGMFNRRDCSRFVMDIYRSFGINLPRDAGIQEEYAAGRKIVFNGNLAARKEILQLIQPGDVIYMPGHVVIYLGEDDGSHFIIHSGAGYAVKTAGGKYRNMSVHSVFICDLEQEMMQKKGKKYLDYFTSARKFY
ncbi:SH3 domain containing protein [Halanaerobium sp. DL-01]|uniref:NlpC/P60 family protein n=1 Tax=Halanaerobium sp. DL-01 TaxID=1653064 RepID=UPI000DF1BE79|nr:NlpC/P60 family protein [Halanaerobium sp. DL-01]RCW81085.1 SH3 domain containing protein [Halanaerobium sp. DL-01]